MAKNFRIYSRKENNILHLKLSGDFDGMSAMELLYALKEKIEAADRIYIDTNELSSLLPFGRVVFQNNFDFSSEASSKMVFTGEYGNQISSF